MRTLHLNNAEWYRGKGSLGSRLCLSLTGADAGMKCCLGIDAVDRGIPTESILGLSSPWELGIMMDDVSALESITEYPTADKYIDEWETLLPDHYEKYGYLPEEGAVVLQDLAIAINDDESIDDEERLRRLRPLFALVGIELVYHADK